MICPNCGGPLILYIIGTESTYPGDREYACRKCGLVGWTISSGHGVHSYHKGTRGFQAMIMRITLLYRERLEAGDEWT